MNCIHCCSNHCIPLDCRSQEVEFRTKRVEEAFSLMNDLLSSKPTRSSISSSSGATHKRQRSSSDSFKAPHIEPSQKLSAISSRLPPRVPTGGMKGVTSLQRERRDRGGKDTALSLGHSSATFTETPVKLKTTGTTWDMGR